MATRGRLFYQYSKNRDGSEKLEENIKSKMFASFTVPREEDNSEGKKYFLTLDFDNGTSMILRFDKDMLIVNTEWKNSEESVAIFNNPHSDMTLLNPFDTVVFNGVDDKYGVPYVLYNFGK